MMQYNNINVKKSFILRLFLLFWIGFVMSENRVFKKQLSNGLTILVVPRHHIPKVSTQIWYNVGSKHEKTGEKGIAHLIEHMIFKGTERLSESDINLITTKLSGSCNAFTSYDYTGYLFDLPTQHWHYGLDILADCMKNCTFKQELLNSELKAVIQELKMYKDNYSHAVIEELLSAIFAGHPYGYPVIGYKGDLFNLNSNALKNFYKHYYSPNNATLIVVGDVQPEEAFNQAERYFGQIEPSLMEPIKPFYLAKDFSAKSVTLYRDVKQPFITCAFVIPGATSKINYLLDVLNWLIGSGRSSRLYKKLIDELDVATEVVSFPYDFFEQGLFLVRVQPKELKNIPEILTQIKKVFEEAFEKGFADREFERAIAQSKHELMGLFESNHQVASTLGHVYLSTGDESYLFDYQNMTLEDVKSGINSLFANYLRPELMHTGFVLPLQEKDRNYWNQLQEISDQEDFRILATKCRSELIEEGSFVDNVKPQDSAQFTYPHYESFTLSNGLEVLYHHDDRVPKIEVTLELKADYLYDPQDKAGLSNFVSQMLLKGTEKYSAAALADLIEHKGMGISSVPGFIVLSLLKKDSVEAFDILNDILTHSIFKSEAIEQVRNKIYNDIADYWDQPYHFVNQLICSHIYGDHPYSKNVLGTLDSIKVITREDLLDFYKRYISPKEARLAIVGDLSGIDLKNVLETTLGGWHGLDIEDLVYPSVSPVKKEQCRYVINRDQVVLSFAGLSVDKKHPDYDKLLLFDQIFGGGVLGAMSSRLFQVREQTGLFYTIAGSLLARSGKQPGLSLVKTIVSLDRLQVAEKAISDVINHSAETLTDVELQQAKRALIHSMVDNFESYRQIVSTFLYLRRYNLPVDYFDKRSEQLLSYDVLSVRQAAQKILNTEKMATFEVGRIG